MSDIKGGMGMRKVGGNQVWYIANDRDGFTAQPDQAMKDPDGVPVICPGDVNRTWNAEFKRAKARREAIWLQLLDAMETAYELEEGIEKLGNSSRRDELKLELQLVRATMEGLRFALAKLELPLSAEPTEADNWVLKRADLKYEQES